MVAVSCLLVRLDSAEIGDVGELDRLIWSMSPSTMFFVQSMYSLLRSIGLPDRLAMNIWKSKMSSKLCFLLWLVYFGKVLTHCNVATDLWGKFLSKFSHQPLALSASMPLLLSVWYGTKLNHLSPRGLILWKSIPHIMCWSL